MRFSTSRGTFALLGTLAILGCSTTSDSANNPPSTANQPPIQLQSHHWTLHQAYTAKGTPDTSWQLPQSSKRAAQTVELDFTSEQRIVVTRLCNSMNGAYATQANNLTISRLASTMMACNDPALMNLERQVGQQLPKATNWLIQEAAQQLELKFQDGSRWVLQGRPTYETLYGQSERQFLEVAPEKVSCHHPLIANMQCLKVRTVHYDSSGIKRQVGNWEMFYDTIEGYTHQPNLRQILRLKRYHRNPAPADASAYIYVFDMAVESEVIR